MSVIIEAFYIFDEHSNCILEHVYSFRPPNPQDLVSRLLTYGTTRPSVVQISDLAPPTTVYSLQSSTILLVCTCSTESQSLAVLEFLHRIVDVFEEFLGGPLLPAKIQDNYEVVAQLLNEICDGGVVSNTEPNSLRDSVEVSTLIGKLFTQVGLPGASPALGATNNLAATLKASSAAFSGPAIPWRRPNVRHTSNELYVDIIEKLSVIFAPSGRPISARAAGSISFTAKISGVPDLVLTLSAPGGTSSAKSSELLQTMQLPVFHPCVRLARWKDHPGELSFVPPDGRFMLAGYEVDLLPSPLDSELPPSKRERVYLPATVDLRTGLGSSGADFEARLILNNNFPGASLSKAGPGPRPSVNTAPFSFGNSSSGSSNAPTLEAVRVVIPLPSQVRSVTDIKATRGDADFDLWKKSIVWRVPTKDGSSIDGIAVLTGTIVGSYDTGAVGSGDDSANMEASKSKAMHGYYDDEALGENNESSNGILTPQAHGLKRMQTNRTLMPRSISVSFSVKGWLASGLKVESLVVDVKRSKGLGEGVRPFKGVKYLTVSRDGVERRAEQTGSQS